MQRLQIVLSWLVKLPSSMVLLGGLLLWAFPGHLGAVTVNKVWFEFHQSFYRVVFEYTTPELKEFRGGYADFKSKKEAEKFFWSLVRGADFQLGEPKLISFPTQKNKPKPW